MSVALFGGTFDPVHLGHISLIIQLHDKFQFSKILVCPAQINPQKVGLQAPRATPSERVHMLRLALGELPAAYPFEVFTYEVEKQGPSYTIDTIAEVQRTHEDVTLILGEDSIKTFSSWRQAEEITSRCSRIVVGQRSVEADEPQIDGDIQFDYLPKRDLNSTDLRNRLASGQYCGHLLPDSVWRFIEEASLYGYSKPVDAKY